MTVQLTDESNRAWVLEQLLRDPGRNAWAIQDLRVWPEKTALYFRKPEGGNRRLDYLLLTGHPGAQRTKTLVLDGTAAGIDPLLAHVPPGPWLVRETPAELLTPLKARAPEAKVYLEHRMEASRASFEPRHGAGKSRRLVATDAAALAEFQGAPPQAARGLLAWIQGAVLFGLWHENQLVAIASTFVRTPEVSELVGIETHMDQRGKGFGTAVTSALMESLLEDSEIISLTVLKDNSPANAVYAKLGFAQREDRIWLDNGVGARP